jgi:Ca2+-binding RTX toxin-like protein
MNSARKTRFGAVSALSACLLILGLFVAVPASAGQCGAVSGGALTVTANTAATLKRDGDNVTVDGTSCNVTVDAIDRIDIVASNLGNSANAVTIDLTGGKFVPGANFEGQDVNDVGQDELEITVNLGTGGVDTLQLVGTTLSDRWTFISQGIDLNSDGDADITGPKTSTSGSNVYANLNPTPPTAPRILISAESGAGSDTFLQKEVTTEKLVGGDGIDRVDYCIKNTSVTPATCTRTGAVTVVLDANAGDGSVSPAENDTVSTDIENVAGGDGGDTITGTLGAEAFTGNGGIDNLNGGPNPGAASGPDTLTGGLGVDTLNGYDGADLLRGGGDNDTLDGLAGKDNLNGGAGNDQESGGDGRDYFDQERDSNGGDVIDGGEGNDTVSYSRRTNVVNVSLDTTGAPAGTANDGESGENDNVFSTIENIRGGKAGDTLNANFPAAATSSHNITGSGGGDTINGASGGARISDTLSGGDGIDTIHANGGGDRIFGGDEGDHLFGEAGADSISGQDGGDDLHGDDGRDRLYGGSGTDSCLDPQGRLDKVSPTYRSGCESTT